MKKIILIIAGLSVFLAIAYVRTFQVNIYTFKGVPTNIPTNVQRPDEIKPHAMTSVPGKPIYIAIPMTINDPGNPGSGKAVAVDQSLNSPVDAK